jgi:hypothetical protein
MTEIKITGDLKSVATKVSAQADQIRALDNALNRGSSLEAQHARERMQAINADLEKAMRNRLGCRSRRATP